ncbi:MAG: MerR family DNA-binding transcriptional regulator [Gammaproteobacteria bacterium]|nr:MerR family DNA-binding transcriptional regulator [Gammaproteobacteria bacterium]
MVSTIHSQDPRLAEAPSPSTDSSTFSISELAREFDITTRTIRFYEDRGLIQPARNGRTRIYSHRDRVRLTLILRGKRIGFSLHEIGEIMDMYDHDAGEVGQLEYMLDKLGARRAQLERQQRDIDVTLAEMARIEAQCHAQLATVAPAGDDSE